MLANIAGFQSPPETLPAGKGRADTRLRRLKIFGRHYYMLVQRGSFPDIAYDHGRLLARELQDGAFPEIIASIGRGTNLPDPVEADVARTLFHALGKRLLDDVTDDFRQAVQALAAGYNEGLGSPRFTHQDVVDALLAIEIENLADGLGRRLTIPDFTVRAGAVGEALEIVLAETPSREVRHLLERGAEEVFGRVLRRIAHPTNRSGFACTGISVPAALTKDGLHLHARNLDADLYKWNDAPAIFLIDETPVGRRHKYVAFGTLGLIYPGGISGINDAGIGASLHQLSTTQYRLRYDRGQAYLAPFLQQCVLRDAGTLDEAIAIVCAAQNLSAWIIHCSDARTGQTVRIEFNGKKTRVGPVEMKSMSQTNHFVDPELVERFFDAGDAHYTPTFGKYLETRTRMTMADAALAVGAAERAIDTDWAIDLLSSGQDPQLVGSAEHAGIDLAQAGVERAFGRVPRKSYGQLMTIVRGDVSRRPGADEAWQTFGDHRPGCQATLVGWHIDWAALELHPVDPRPLRRTQQYVRSGRANWETSFDRYVAARIAAVRPREAGGAVLSRTPTPAETQGAYRQSEALLTEAIALAGEDGIVEIPYYFMRARVRHELADYEGAASDWDLLRGIWAAQSSRPVADVKLPVPNPRFRPVLHDYEAALMLALSVVTEDKRQRGAAWDGRVQRLDEAGILLKDLQSRFFSGKPAHFGLVGWIDRVSALSGPHPEAVKIPEPDFVTIE